MRKRAGLMIAAVLTALALSISASAVSAAPTPLPNGFTAKVVAASGETITGQIDATGYDLGIYIGPGVTGVTIRHAVVKGANDEGIMVQDASDVLITGSVVKDNAVDPVNLSELKGIVLAGSTHVVVKSNTVQGNRHGGIGIYDDGPNSPFAPNPVNIVPVASTGNVVMNNLVKDNGSDCGIVVAAKNPGGGVARNVVSKNSVISSDSSGAVGGIVVAGGGAGPVAVTDNLILHNEVSGGLIPGISLHAFGPGVISGTKLIGNVLSHNGGGELSHNTTGIEIFAIPSVGTISGTQVLSDAVSDDHFGVWHLGDTGTHIAHLTTDGVADPVAP